METETLSESVEPRIGREMMRVRRRPGGCGESGVLGTNEKGQRASQVCVPQEVGGPRVGSHDPRPTSPNPGDGEIEAGDAQRHREDRSSRSPNHVRIEGVGVGIGRDHRVGPYGIGSPEQSAQIPRLLDRLGHQEQGIRSRCQMIESHIELSEDPDHSLRSTPIRGPIQGSRRHRHLGPGALRWAGELGRVVVNLERSVTLGDCPGQVPGALDDEHRLPFSFLAIPKRDQSLDPGVRRRIDIHQPAQRSR